MAVKCLRMKCLFLPDYCPFGRRGPWRAPRRCLTLACPAIFGLRLVLRLGQYSRPSQLQLGFLLKILRKIAVFALCKNWGVSLKN